MADINATALNAKTTPDGTDDLVLFNQNTNVGYKIDYDDLADAILNKLTSKTFANQVGGSSAATLLSQLSTLNSNITPVSVNLVGANGFTIDTNKSYRVGKLLVIICDGHTTESISSTGQFLSFNSAGTTPCTGATIAVGKGSTRWAVDGVQYAYISTNSLNATLASGIYLHISVVIPLN